jgi:hypothetical protein
MTNLKTNQIKYVMSNTTAAAAARFFFLFLSLSVWVR